MVVSCPERHYRILVLSHTELLSVFHVFLTRYRFVRPVFKSCGLQIISTFRHGHHPALRPPSPPLQGQQDVALATRMEIHEGGHRTVPVHASMVGWISQKMAGLLANAAAGLPVPVVQVGWFDHQVLVHTVELLYQGWLVLDTEEEAEDVQDMLDTMVAVDSRG